MKKIGLFLMAFLMICMMACKEKQNEVTEVFYPELPEKEKTVIIARIAVKEGKENEFIEIASKLVAATRAEEGNLFYSLYQSTEDPLIFIVYEEYKDDAAFDTHAKSAHFAAFAEATKDITAGELMLDHLYKFK